MLVSVELQIKPTQTFVERFSQLSQENVGRWSSGADAIDVNKLFGVRYGCSPPYSFLNYPGHVSVVIRGVWSQLAAK